MLINYQKNYNQSALQSFKSSFIKLSETGASRQASLVKKVALAVINLLLIPFRLAQGAYRLLKVKSEPKRGFFNHVLDSEKSIRELNQSTILKTALVGAGAAGLIALGHKPSASSSQVDLLSNISSLVLKIGSLPVIYSLISFAFNREKKPTVQTQDELSKIVDRATKTPSFPISPTKMLPTNLVFKISNDYLDEISAASFNVAARINRKEAIRRKNTLAGKEILKISNSRECSELFAQILNSRSLSSITKLDSIKSHLQTEVNNFNIAKDQIDFADKLVAKLKELFPNDETLNKLEKSIEATKALEISEITKANAINSAIISSLNSDDDLKKAASSLDLSETKLHKMWQHAEKLSNIEVLKLDFSMESLSIVTFVEGVRKSYIAEAQIDFADVLVAELERQFPDDVTLNAIKASIENIKNEHKNPIKKAEEINNTIISHLNSDSSDTSIKYELRKLNLNSKQLKAILPCISEFPNLAELHLYHNQLTVLPESIGGLKNLRNLYLINNQLTMLPESICGLTNLRSLFLEVNQLTLLPESIGGLTYLEWLSLDNNQLTVLPESISGLRNLERLGLDKNRLTVLPESIGGLTDLHYLSLANNQLTVLPESIGRLTSLRDLYLNYNQLTLLPESIGDLTDLQRLSLANNQLTVLPESIGRLTSLRDLYIHNNQLTLLPESIGGLTDLHHLSLANNQLTLLPESIGRLTKLWDLYIHNNQLTVLPESIGGLTDLHRLFLSNNQLTVLPESIGRLTSLTFITTNYGAT